MSLQKPKKKRLPGYWKGVHGPASKSGAQGLVSKKGLYGERIGKLLHYQHGHLPENDDETEIANQKARDDLHERIFRRNAMEWFQSRGREPDIRYTSYIYIHNDSNVTVDVYYRRFQLTAAVQEETHENRWRQFYVKGHRDADPACTRWGGSRNQKLLPNGISEEPQVAPINFDGMQVCVKWDDTQFFRDIKRQVCKTQRSGDFGGIPHIIRVSDILEYNTLPMYKGLDLITGLIPPGWTQPPTLHPPVDLLKEGVDKGIFKPPAWQFMRNQLPEWAQEFDFSNYTKPGGYRELLPKNKDCQFQDPYPYLIALEPHADLLPGLFICFLLVIVRFHKYYGFQERMQGMQELLMHSY